VNGSTAYLVEATMSKKTVRARPAPSIPGSPSAGMAIARPLNEREVAQARRHSSVLREIKIVIADIEIETAKLQQSKAAQFKRLADASRLAEIFVREMAIARGGNPDVERWEFDDQILLLSKK
jgi:hypothetical protein